MLRQAEHTLRCCGCLPAHRRCITTDGSQHVKKSKPRAGFRGSTFPNSLVTLPGSGLGLMAMLAAYVGTLLLLGMTLTVGDTLMKMGEA